MYGLHQIQKGRGAGWLIALVLLAIAVTMPVAAQVFEWAHQGGGTGWKHGNAIATENAGNTLVAGEFSGTIDLDGMALTSFGDADGFIARYDAAGSIVWRVQLGVTNGSVVPTAIAISVSGNELYVTGEIYVSPAGPSFNFSPTITVPNANAQPGSSFIAKYTITSGGLDPVWITTIHAPPTVIGSALATGIAVDVAGNAYVCGNFSGKMAFDNGATTPVSQSSAVSLFLAAYSGTTGTLLQPVQQGTDAGSSFGTGVSVINTVTGPEAVVTGYIAGPVKFGLLPATGSANGDLVVVRYNAAGPLWVAASQSLNSAGSASGRSVALDGGGNAYVTGKFTGKVRFTQNPFDDNTSPTTDYFVAKYDPSGNLIWRVQGNADEFSDAFGNAIAVRNSDLYVTGGFSGTMTNIPLTSMGNHDIFVAHYDNNGILKWGRRSGNYYADLLKHIHYDEGRGIAIDPSGSACVVGDFTGSAKFGLIPSLTNGPSDFRDIFVTKLSPEASSVSGTVFDNLAAGGPSPDYGAGDRPLANRIVRITFDHGNGVVDYEDYTTGSDGNYRAYVAAGTYHAQTVDIPWRVANFPLSPSADYLLIASGLGSDVLPNRNFGFDPFGKDRHVDLHVELTVLTTENAVPGADVRYLISYDNLGGSTVTDADVEISYDPLYHRLDFSSTPWHASDPLAILTAGPPLPTPAPPLASMLPFRWHIPTLDPMARGRIILTGTLNPVRVGSLPSPPDHVPDLDATVTILPTSGDANPLDNTTAIAQVMWRPSDPNGKIASPDGNIGVSAVRRGTGIDYRVDFYNKGNTPATEVVIRDTLDGIFDIASSDDIQVVDASPRIGSARALPSVASSPLPPNRTVVAFTFRGVSLEGGGGSVSGSHGFVLFRLRLKTNPSIGREFVNAAWVFFNGPPGLATTMTWNCVSPDFSANGFCFGDTTRFATSDGSGSFLPAGVTHLQWQFGDGDSTSSANPVHLYTHPGLYQVMLTIQDTARICDSPDSLFVVRKWVEILPSPGTPNITSNGNILTSSPAPSYQWLRNANEIPGETGQSYTITVPGSYSVRVMNAVGCSAISNPVTLGVGEEYPEDRTVTVEPNPGTGRFRLGLPPIRLNGGHIIVMDIEGKEIRRIALTPGKGEYEIDLEGCPSGVYIARIEIDGKQIIRRLVLRR